MHHDSPKSSDQEFRSFLWSLIRISRNADILRSFVTPLERLHRRLPADILKSLSRWSVGLSFLIFFSSFIYSFIHSFIHSVIHSSIRPSGRAYVRSFLRWFVHLPFFFLSLSSFFSYSLSVCLTHSLIHPSIHPSVRACAHSFRRRFVDSSVLPFFFFLSVPLFSFFHTPCLCVFFSTFHLFFLSFPSCFSFIFQEEEFRRCMMA